MNVRKTICIDGRTAGQVYAETARRLKDRLQVDAAKDPKTEALIRVFARYCEVIIDRLDALPERNYLAFLDTLRLARTQPIPARVPLNFKAVKGVKAVKGTSPALKVTVKEGTQVAAPPVDGSSDPLVFETSREIALTQASLEKVVAVDPRTLKYQDLSHLAAEQKAIDVESSIAIEEPLPHQLFINHAALFDAPGMSTLGLSVEVPAASYLGNTDKRAIEWCLAVTDGPPIPLTVASDTTAGLLQSGEVVFSEPPDWPLAKVFGREAKWLTGRLLESKELGDRNPALFVGSENRLSIKLHAHWEPEAGPFTLGFNNSFALDLSSDFLPLGEQPKFGDNFFLRSALFGVHHMPIELHFRLTSRTSNDKPSATAQNNNANMPSLKWQIGNGKTWTDLDAEDNTESLTQSGSVRFTVPDKAAVMVVNGEEGYWIRARLVGGDYGEEERIEFSPEFAPTGLRRIDSTLVPPLVASISLTAGPSFAERLITRNGLIFEQPSVDSYIVPFHGNSEESAALYFGFKDPANDGSSLANRFTDLYVHVAGRLDPRPCVREAGGTAGPAMRWQYWNGEGWVASDSRDTSDAFSEPGIVSLWAAEDLRPWKDSVFCSELYWYRALCKDKAWGNLTLLTHIAVNTVMASHTLTLEREVLGSSNGGPDLRFTTARAPVIGIFELEVLEKHTESPKTLFPVEHHATQTNRARDRDTAKSAGSWILWEEVKDLSRSDSSDRHFTLNREVGELVFGDNIHGRIPPKGVNNIRVRRYRTGGGRNGNTNKDTVRQLRTSRPGVDSVNNPIASEGGEDAESLDALKARGSRWLRHRDRAVTAEDYEDLAKMASPTVALAKCYPNRDLTDLGRGRRRIPGTISLVVVPYSNDPKPMAALPLLRQVYRYVGERCPVDVKLRVVGPRYLPVGVEAQIVPLKPEQGQGLIHDCAQALDRYLHPVNGGLEGNGWDFGRKPFESDLYAVLEDLPGIRFIRQINLRGQPDDDHAVEFRDFVVCSGTHRIGTELGVV